LILEGKVEGLSREVPNDVGCVSTPQGRESLIGNHTFETIPNTSIGTVQAARLEHLILVLDEQLDSLNGGGGCLGNSGGHTTHQKIDGKGCEIVLLLHVAASLAKKLLVGV